MKSLTTKVLSIFFSTLLVLLVIFPAFSAQAREQGIYISETTINNAQHLKYLIDKSKEVGINTFVIDFRYMSKSYQENIALVKKNGIKYVARIVVFPDGGKDPQVSSVAYWEKRYQLVDQAIKLGAEEIQLDYVRYTSKQPPSSRNAQNIYKVIKWYKNKLAARGIPLQIDVFGSTCFGDSIYIGQSLTLFADSVDAICPMVYPSHFEPYRKYAKIPYEAVRVRLAALRKQFHGKIPFKVYPFIEMYNYRYPLSEQQKKDYIAKQIAAVDDNGMDGWYVWNIHNKYDNLFLVLKNRKAT